MADIIAVLILLILIGGAVAYIVRAKEKRREMYRLSGRRKLSRQREDAEKETGGPRDRQKNDADLRNDMRALCDECNADSESDRRRKSGSESVIRKSEDFL